MKTIVIEPTDELDDQYLLKMKLTDFGKMIKDPQINLDEMKSLIIDLLTGNEDEKNAIEMQLDLAINKGQSIAHENDGTWHYRAERALVFRKLNIAKLQRMLFLLNIKLKQKHIDESAILVNRDKVFYKVCKHTLDEETFSKIEQITKNVLEVLTPITDGEFNNFLHWKNAFTAKNPDNYDFLKIVELYKVLVRRNRK